MKLLPFLLTLFAGAGSFSPVLAQPHDYQQFVPGGALIAQFHLKERCYGLSAVAVDDYIYLFGGDTPPDAVGTIQRIDTKTNRIETLASSISPRYFSATARIGDSIYIFGGAQLVNPFHSASSIVQRFDIRTATVTTLGRSRSPLSMASAAVVGDKIYILDRATQKGNPPKYQNTLWIYDPATDDWKQGTPPLTDHTSKIIEKDGTIYALGGFRHEDNEKANVCEAYDVASNTWHPLPDLPFELKGHDATLIGNSIFTFGDYKDMSRVELFDLQTQTWKHLFFTGFDGRQFPSICVVKDKIYVMGGKLDFTGYYLDQVQVFDSTKLQ